MKASHDSGGALIRRRRQARGLTQRELAAAAGVSLGTLRDLEQGRTTRPHWTLVATLTAQLGIEGERVRIDLLGPLAAWRDEARVALGSMRQRAVLGLLALHAGVGLHRDAIIDVLWGGRPPSSAVPQVQGYVCRLRGLLGGAQLVATDGASYRLHAGEAVLDLAEFRQLTRLATSTASDDPAGACRHFERALALWRGDALADIALLREHPAVVELASVRADAVLAFADAAARLAAPGRALPDLRDLCARERFNERAHARLMLALAATSQQAAALEVFDGLRHRLDRELGINPGASVRQAHVQILRQQAG